MAHIDTTFRVTGIHFDYATWHAHLAARETPSRLIFVSHRAGAGAKSVPTIPHRIIRLNFATWKTRLAGSTKTAA